MSDPGYEVMDISVSGGAQSLQVAFGIGSLQALSV